MHASRRFLQLDVFADRPGAGNALAVVLDSEGLDDQAMQAFARWTNLSETTFLLPPTKATASYRVRIFTPRQELPFAGHPSVGSAHAALESGLASAQAGRLVQECAAGLLPMRVEGESAQRRIFVRAPKGRERDMAFAGKLLGPALAGVTLGSLPACIIDNGPHWLLVELASEADVRSLRANLPAISALTTEAGTVGLAVFARASHPDYQLVVRAFCPADGIPEDPVTGSANAAIGAWLLQHDALPSRRYRASQGRELGRDGRVEVEIDDAGEVWIGGCTQTVIRGGLAW
jgi:PhzF family phenazine biosynthesis protein